jgi:hypothetical protein
MLTQLEPFHAVDRCQAMLQFFQWLGGSVHVTFKAGTFAAWLDDLLKPHVTKVLVSAEELPRLSCLSSSPMVSTLTSWTKMPSNCEAVSVIKSKRKM